MPSGFIIAFGAGLIWPQRKRLYSDEATGFRDYCVVALPWTVSPWWGQAGRDVCRVAVGRLRTTRRFGSYSYLAEERRKDNSGNLFRGRRDSLQAEKRP